MMEIGRPKMAIICANSLTVIGLKQLLLSVMPSMEIEDFISVRQLEDSDPDRFIHYFVDFNILLTDRPFFLQRVSRTIVLTTSDEHAKQLQEFHCLRVTVPEKQLVKSLLYLQQLGHSRGKMPVRPRVSGILSAREVEVLSLLVQGCINKEVADRLCISLATVITHRKNITEKLGIRSLSGLTIYAVMNGYVDIDQI